MAKKLAILHQVDYDKVITESAFSKQVNHVTLTARTPSIVEMIMAGVQDSYEDSIKANM